MNCKTIILMLATLIISITVSIFLNLGLIKYGPKIEHWVTHTITYTQEGTR